MTRRHADVISSGRDPDRPPRLPGRWRLAERWRHWRLVGRWRLAAAGVARSPGAARRELLAGSC